MDTIKVRTFTKEEIVQMPTIEDVIANFKAIIDDFVDDGGWENHPILGHFPVDAGWDLPNSDFCNNAEDSQFVAARTQLGVLH